MSQFNKYLEVIQEMKKKSEGVEVKLLDKVNRDIFKITYNEITTTIQFFTKKDQNKKESYFVRVFPIENDFIKLPDLIKYNQTGQDFKDIIDSEELKNFLLKKFNTENIAPVIKMLQQYNSKNLLEFSMG